MLQSILPSESGPDEDLCLDIMQEILAYVDIKASSAGENDGVLSMSDSYSGCSEAAISEIFERDVYGEFSALQDSRGNWAGIQGNISSRKQKKRAQFLEVAQKRNGLHRFLPKMLWATIRGRETKCTV